MSADTRYVALVLKEVSGATLHKRLLWLPLALACSISEYYHIVFPMKSSVSWIIDAAFDEVLKYLHHGRHKTLKDFVTNSKGILYAKDLTVEESTRVLDRAAHILTTDEKIEAIALEKGLPHVFISRPHGEELNVKARYLEDKYYEQLKRILPGCVEVSLRMGGSSGTNHRNNGRSMGPELIGDSPLLTKAL